MAATFVLVCSNAMIAAFNRYFPRQVRMPCFIVVIASFVTAVELLMKAYSPDLNRALGIFVPLIVVNCIILGRAEAFASKNGMLRSILEGRRANHPFPEARTHDTEPWWGGVGSG